MSADGCPVWCGMHPPLEPEVHTGTVFATRFTIGLVQRPGQDVTIHVGEAATEGLSVDDAQWLVRAVQMAVVAARHEDA